MSRRLDIGSAKYQRTEKQRGWERYQSVKKKKYRDKDSSLPLGPSSEAAKAPIVLAAFHIIGGLAAPRHCFEKKAFMRYR